MPGATALQLHLAVERQTEAIPRLLMCVNPNNLPTYRFLSKKTIKYADSVYDLKYSVKELIRVEARTATVSET
jgi:hypothetical protein